MIEAEVLGLSGKKEEGKKRLDTAKARIDEMGCHRWDSEVERISESLKRWQHGLKRILLLQESNTAFLPEAI